MIWCTKWGQYVLFHRISQCHECGQSVFSFGVINNRWTPLKVCFMLLSPPVQRMSFMLLNWPTLRLFCVTEPAQLSLLIKRLFSNSYSAQLETVYCASELAFLETVYCALEWQSLEPGYCTPELDSLETFFPLGFPMSTLYPFLFLRWEQWGLCLQRQLCVLLSPSLQCQLSTLATLAFGGKLCALPSSSSHHRRMWTLCLQIVLSFLHPEAYDSPALALPEPVRLPEPVGPAGHHEPESPDPVVLMPPEPEPEPKPVVPMLPGPESVGPSQPVQGPEDLPDSPPPLLVTCWVFWGAQSPSLPAPSQVIEGCFLLSLAHSQTTWGVLCLLHHQSSDWSCPITSTSLSVAFPIGHQRRLAAYSASLQRISFTTWPVFFFSFIFALLALFNYFQTN